VRVNDAVIGLALLVLGGFILWQTFSFPAMPGQDYGPELLPRITATGFLITGLCLCVMGLRAAGEQPWVALSAAARDPGRQLDAALVLGGIVLLLLVWSTVGFLIAASVLSTVLVARFRRGHVLGSAALCVAFCLAIDLAFRRLLLVPLPQGPLTGIFW
jgi:putative tricarboxylic transport membrane protein